MITLPSGVLDLLDEGRISIRGLIKFEFGTGTYGFIRANVPYTWNGLTYQPGGILQVSDLAGGLGVTAKQFTVTLAASGNDALTPEVLRQIEDEDYRDRPVTVYDAYFHPDTGALLTVQAMKRGYLDTIDHEEGGDDGYKLVLTCETRALDYTRTNARTRTVEDQARRAPGDLIYEHAAKRGREEIWWGREKAK